MSAFALFLSMNACGSDPADEARKLLEKDCECEKLFDQGKEKEGWECFREVDKMSRDLKMKYANDTAALRIMKEAAADFKCK